MSTIDIVIERLAARMDKYWEMFLVTGDPWHLEIYDLAANMHQRALDLRG